MAIYENASFRRMACVIDLPSGKTSRNPQLNGLVDRYSGYTNAQAVLFDTALFPDAKGQLQALPEGFAQRRP